MTRILAFTPVLDYFKSTLSKVVWNTDRDLIKSLLLESEVAIEKINSDVHKCQYDKYSNNFDQKHFEMSYR